MALKERRIDYNPCTLIQPLKRVEERARDTTHRALTLEETEAFFAEAEARHSCYLNVYRIALCTGMRVGEIGALLPQDVKNGTISINKTITRREAGNYVIGSESKTAAGRRTIPMNDNIRSIIQEQKKINSLLDNGIIEMDRPIFRAVEGGLLMSTPVNREIRRICNKTGIKPFTAHAFRDTFATRCIEAGINPRTVQELLGHADFNLTMNLYGHVMDKTKAEAMETIDVGLKAI
jgi:integrase